jgi:hypothetical protein
MPGPTVLFQQAEKAGDQDVARPQAVSSASFNGSVNLFRGRFGSDAPYKPEKSPRYLAKYDSSPCFEYNCMRFLDGIIDPLKASPIAS